MSDHTPDSDSKDVAQRIDTALSKLTDSGQYDEIMPHEDATLDVKRTKNFTTPSALKSYILRSLSDKKAGKTGDKINDNYRTAKNMIIACMYVKYKDNDEVLKEMDKAGASDGEMITSPVELGNARLSVNTLKNCCGYVGTERFANNLEYLDRIQGK